MATGADIGYLAARVSRWNAKLMISGIPVGAVTAKPWQANGAPAAGRRRHNTTYRVTKRAPLHCRGRPANGLAPFVMAPLHATARLPRHASRGWSRVGARLSCADLRSVIPFYCGSGTFEKGLTVIDSLS